MIYNYNYAIKPRIVGGVFNPVVNIPGLNIYINQNTNVNTKIAANFVAANSEYLSSTSTDFDKEDDSFTFGGWYYVDDIAASRTLIGKWGDSSNKKSYTLFVSSSDGKLKLSCSNDGTTEVNVTTTNALSLGAWHFIAGVHDSVNNLIKLKLDSDSFVTIAFSGGVYKDVSPVSFKIGASETSFAQGRADAQFFFDKALTFAELEAIYNSDSGTDFSALEDYNGNEYAIGQSLNGIDQAFNIDGILTDLSDTTTGEWEVYVTPVDATPTSNNFIISFGDANDSAEIDVRVMTSGKCRANCFIGGIVYWTLETDSAVFSDGVSTKVGLKHNGATATILIDDVEVAQTNTATDATKWFNDASSLDVGRIGCLEYNSVGNNLWLNGTIQNIKIWGDDTRTNLVGSWLMNNVEGASQLNEKKNAIVLNGVDQALNTDASLPSLATTTTGEWEVYFTPNNAAGIEQVIGFADANGEELIALGNFNGKAIIYVNPSVIAGSQSITDSIVFTSGVQTKVNVIQDGVELTILIDDIEVAQTRTGPNSDWWFNDLPLLDNGRIGAIDWNSLGNVVWTDGIIKNVRIWGDDTRTNLVAHYIMDNSTGVVLDIENGFDATEIGSPTFISLNSDAIPIGTPVSALASVNNTTISDIESDLVDWWKLNEVSGDRAGELGHTLTDNNTVGYAVGKVQEESEVGNSIYNWIDQSPNTFIFKQDTLTKQPNKAALSVDFDGVDDGLSVAGSNLLNDSSGIIFFSNYFNSSGSNTILTSCDESTNNHVFELGLLSTGEIRLSITISGVTTTISSTNQVVNGAYYYGYLKSTGASYVINLNGVDEILVGTDNGYWFADVLNRDNLAIGATIRLSPLYGINKSNKLIYSNAALTSGKINAINNFMSNPNN